MCIIIVNVQNVHVYVNNRCTYTLPFGPRFPRSPFSPDGPVKTHTFSGEFLIKYLIFGIFYDYFG